MARPTISDRLWNRLNTLKWIANSFVVLGAGTIALSTHYAAQSTIPFLLTISGQILALYCSIKLRDLPYVGLSICFILLDICGIYIRFFS